MFPDKTKNIFRLFFKIYPQIPNFTKNCFSKIRTKTSFRADFLLSKILKTKSSFSKCKQTPTKSPKPEDLGQCTTAAKGRSRRPSMETGLSLCGLLMETVAPANELAAGVMGFCGVRGRFVSLMRRLRMAFTVGIRREWRPWTVLLRNHYFFTFFFFRTLSWFCFLISECLRGF